MIRLFIHSIHFVCLFASIPNHPGLALAFCILFMHTKHHQIFSILIATVINSGAIMTAYCAGMEMDRERERKRESLALAVMF